MSFKYNLLKARSYLAMVIGILIAFSIVLYVENNSEDSGDSRVHIATSIGRPLIPSPRPLNPEEMIWAREGANKQVISSQADSLIKISRIWADFFPANTSNQPI